MSKLLCYLNNNLENACSSESLANPKHSGVVLCDLILHSFSLNILIRVVEFPIFYFDRVDHTVTIEQMNPVTLGHYLCVGTISKVHSCDVFGGNCIHFILLLLLYRSKVTLQVRIFILWYMHVVVKKFLDVTEYFFSVTNFILC